MAFWDGLERVVKLAGILGGAAAVAGVYVQLSDVLTKEKQKNIEDWQNSAVYKIIEDNQSPIAFRDIFPRYSAAASNFPADIPKTNLDEPHLRLAIIRLMQSQAIIEVGRERYSARNYVDPQELNIKSLQMIDKLMKNTNVSLASHVQLAMQVISQNKDPLTSDQLRQRMIAAGGDKEYLQDSMVLVLQQMSMQGLVKFWPDGRYSVADNAPSYRVEVLPDARIKSILSEIDGEMLRYIMTNEAGFIDSYCFSSKDPDDLKEGSLLRRLEHLNLVTISQSVGGKDANGKPCTASARASRSDFFGSVQGYYYQYLATVAR
jgi:hypothetical protein